MHAQLILAMLCAVWEHHSQTCVHDYVTTHTQLPSSKPSTSLCPLRDSIQRPSVCKTVHYATQPSVPAKSLSQFLPYVVDRVEYAR